jgi:hypothetical protein
MEPSPEKYRRLTKNNSEVGSYTSLWVGSDHVMIVRSSGYHEEYVRLHLGEIRAVFLTVTERRRWWGLFWGIVAGGGVLPFLVSSGGGVTPGKVFGSILLGLGGLGLLWNHLLGPGCRAFAVTGVQNAELPSLVRMKQARKVMARLHPLINAAQSHLAPPVQPAPSPEPPPAPPPPAAGV